MLLLGTLVMGVLIFRVVRVNVRDQTELTMLRDELTSINHTLQTMALADGLTGLANRRQFDLFLSQALKTASLTGRPVSLIMLDIDYFKRYNDAYGHVAGDNCLRHVGEALQKLNLRQSDLIARYGGEEFAIILPDTDRDAAFNIAQRAVAAVSAIQLPHSESLTGKKVVTLSAGCYSLIPRGSDDDARMLKEGADAALYSAKMAGRDRAVISEVQK